MPELYILLSFTNFIIIIILPKFYNSYALLTLAHNIGVHIEYMNIGGKWEKLK